MKRAKKVLRFFLMVFKKKKNEVHYVFAVLPGNSMDGRRFKK